MDEILMISIKTSELIINDKEISNLVKSLNDPISNSKE
jgi:hypothetical protein